MWSAACSAWLSAQEKNPTKPLWLLVNTDRKSRAEHHCTHSSSSSSRCLSSPYHRHLFIPSLRSPLAFSSPPFISPTIITALFHGVCSLSCSSVVSLRHLMRFLLWFIQMQRLELGDSAAGRMHSAWVQTVASTSCNHYLCKWAFLVQMNHAFTFSSEEIASTVGNQWHYFFTVACLHPKQEYSGR